LGYSVFSKYISPLLPPSSFVACTRGRFYLKYITTTSFHILSQPDIIHKSSHHLMSLNKPRVTQSKLCPIFTTYQHQTCFSDDDLWPFKDVSSCRWFAWIIITLQITNTCCGHSAFQRRLSSISLPWEPEISFSLRFTQCFIHDKVTSNSVLNIFYWQNAQLLNVKLYKVKQTCKNPGCQVAMTPRIICYVAPSFFLIYAGL
jgi:hypothetical protein